MPRRLIARRFVLTAASLVFLAIAIGSLWAPHIMAEPFDYRLPSPARRFVELGEEAKPFFPRAQRGACAEPGLGVELGQDYCRELLDQLVQADLAMPGQLAETLVLLFRETDRQGAHSPISFRISTDATSLSIVSRSISTRHQTHCINM